MKAADESVVLVPVWLLRSVILADSYGVGMALAIPRNRAWAISHERLSLIIDQKELPLRLDRSLPAIVVLLAEPDEDWLASATDAQVLRTYWAMLFHARLHHGFKRCLSGQGHVPSGIQDRIERIGRVTFNDARFVLARERLLAPTADDAETYARFAAVFLEMAWFEPQRLPRFFATVDDPRRILDAFGEDLDAEALLRGTRPAGAAEPLRREAPLAAPAAADAPHAEERIDPAACAAQQRHAARIAAAGNDIGAAIVYERAAIGSRAQPDPRRAGGNPYFIRFVERLTAALKMEEATPWSDRLAPLLARAVDGRHNAEARLLYDLQKVCTDSEREVYALDAFAWLLTLGRRPLRRPVPLQRMVLICKRLGSAIGRLDRCRIDPDQRSGLEHLLRTVLGRRQADLRDRLRPPVVDAMERSGLRPRGAVEQVAHENLVEGFLDGIVRRGFARMGDLRDTLSRHQLKLRDLREVSGLLWGDQLLQIDRRLRDPLDGVYHAGETYLRFFQRISSVLFATRIGRIFTYYGLIPFGGAFIVLEVLSRTIGRLINALDDTHLSFEPFSHSGSLLTLLGMGSFLLALVNVPGFRAGLSRSLRLLGRAWRWFILDWSGWRLCRRFVEAVTAAYAWRMALRYLIKPGILALLAWQLFLRDVPPAAAVPILLGVYGLAAVVLNSLSFRLATHTLAHSLVVLWHRLVGDVVGGMFRLVVRIFRLLLDRLERTLYSVDEWFRFRAGQGAAALIIKMSLGSLWRVVAWWVRFGVTLLAEPQINPIKHFPVVTVSHKIILPMVPFVVRRLETLGMSSVKANAYVTTTAFLIPGVFGFLAWELKENWKLYRANRARSLQPVRMGPHGETLAQLLRPGFHSGTVARIFARLRRAEPAEDGLPSETSLLRHQRALQQVREALMRFVRREFAGLLNRHPAWAATPVTVGRVDLAATRLRVALLCPLKGEPAVLAFEQQDGWIVAGIDAPGWMRRVTASQAAILGVAVLGLYQMAGVDLVREQIERLFAPLTIRWCLRDTSLIVWTGLRFGAQVRYSLKARESIWPAAEPPSSPLPAAAVPELLLRHRPLAWDAWSRLWDVPASDWTDDLAEALSAGASVLPPAASAGTTAVAATDAGR